MITTTSGKEINSEAILELAKVIEPLEDTRLDDPAGFCMRHVDHNCGSPACIAGWERHLNLDLGLTLGDPRHAQLYMPDNRSASFMVTDPGDPRFISAKRAAKT